jgi:hypothetical protein
MLRLWQHTLLAIVVDLRGALDNTLYWVLLWVMWGFGKHTLLGIIRSDVGCLHQHTLLGNVVGLCWAFGNTLYWVDLMLLAEVGPRATHFTG